MLIFNILNEVLYYWSYKISVAKLQLLSLNLKIIKYLEVIGSSLKGFSFWSGVWKMSEFVQGIKTTFARDPGDMKNSA